MNMNIEFSYKALEALGSAITTGEMVYNVLSILLAIAGYILSSMGIYAIAKRRGIANAWLAWVPVANMWVLGSISDQFRYITKAQVRSRRKVLLILSIVNTVAAVAMAVVLSLGAIDLLGLVDGAAAEEQIVKAGLGLLFQLVGFGALVGILSLVLTVFRFMALYDLYLSVNPPYTVVFLVLSIVFRVTEPFFIFFNRQKDGGMPPRCDVPQEPANYNPAACIPEPPVQEVVEEEIAEEPVAEAEEEISEEPAEEAAEDILEEAAEEISEEPVEETAEESVETSDEEAVEEPSEENTEESNEETEEKLAEQ